MALTRRKMIKLVGGGCVLAASAAAGVFATTRTPHRALAPWAAAGSYADARMNALSFAILAPNPHNLQPWLVELVGSDRLTIFRDPAIRLPETDPFDRQLTIGMGCFLEQMIIAASGTGHAVELETFPHGDSVDAPVAVARFHADSARPDALGQSILQRRSCKQPFSERPLTIESIDALTPMATVITDPERVAEIRQLTWAAHRVETTTTRTYRESVEVMRFGRREIEANPDGIDLGGPLLETMMMLGLLTREGQLDPTTAEFRQGLEMYRRMLEATPAYAVLTSTGNTRQDQIAAGRRYLRLNLTTTALGLALHPVSQALQEYPEMAEYYEAAHRMLAEPGETVQMLARLGYGPIVPPSPRWPLNSRLTRTAQAPG